jgi:glycerol uptake facilitator protein
MNVYLAEFIGTALLITMGSGVVANVVLKDTKGQNGGWMVITTAWALGVFIGVVVAGPYSGAHLNPAVSLALAITGDFSWSLFPGYIVSQVFGAAVGATASWLVYKDHFDLTADAETKFAPFGTVPAIRNYGSNFLSEVVGTFVLIIVILHITHPMIEDGEGIPIGLGAIGALPVAFLVWVIGLSLGGTTGYAINPARDLGPRLVHSVLPIKGKGGSDWKYSWVPIVGPLVGAGLASALYLFLTGI